MSEATAAPFSRLLSDERLTRRAVGGDEQAFAAIFHRYHQSLFRFCLAIVGNPDDASEALQNTMIKVLRALPGEERRIELKPWLYRIAHNESIDLLRRRRETRQLDVEQVAPGYGLADQAATRERLRRLLTDLNELPERQREVLVMRELAGLEFDEIGSALDTSGAVARQTLYEARQSLHQMEEGREMSCETVARALSDGDGRVTRRRDVRAHLRSCVHCQAFREEIEGRQRDLAALAPLPAVAAAGMLHGLVGGSQGATAGGGLATTLGGGAAKTIGASAMAKGVATAAVVAAIGVTAADRGGVIHLSLPGEQVQKSAAPKPSSDRAGSEPSDGGSGVGSVGSGGGSSNPKDAGERAAAKGPGSATTAPGTAALGASGNHGSSAAHGHPSPHEEVSAEAQGPSGEHPSGQDHAKQYPEAATGGQESATSHKPPPRETGGDGESPGATPQSAHPEHPVQPEHPVHPEHPDHPETSPPPQSSVPTPASPEEAPANPPAPAPELPAPAQAQGSEHAASAAGDPPGKGRGPEKAR